MSIKRFFHVNNTNVFACYSYSHLQIFIYRQKFDLVVNKKIVGVLDFWITNDFWIFYVVLQDQVLTLNITLAFKTEISIKLIGKDLKAFKVSGKWIYIVFYDGINSRSHPLVLVFMPRMAIMLQTWP